MTFELEEVEDHFIALDLKAQDDYQTLTIGDLDRIDWLIKLTKEQKEKLKFKEVVGKATNSLIKEQSKKVKHLFPLEKIAGYGQLCDKVVELEEENEKLVELKRSINSIIQLSHLDEKDNAKDKALIRIENLIIDWGN